MDLISAGIILLVFIVLIVFSVKAAKTWHWVNVVFVNLTFLATVGASIGLSQAWHLRQRDQKAEQSAEELMERAKKEAQLAISGNPDSSSYDPDSLRHKAQQVQLMFLGRGQVWPNGTGTVEDGKHKFTFASPRPADDKMVLKDVELHLFADEPILEQAYPVRYIGRVSVVEESPTELVLTPVRTGEINVLVDEQEWNNPSSTWTLFEHMPLDRHDTFRKLILSDVKSFEAPNPEELKLAEDIENDGEEVGSKRQMEIGPYRQLLEARYLPPETFGLDANSAEYERIIDSYAFDGFTLGKIQEWIEQNAGSRVNRSFEPPAEELFVRYKFNTPSKDEYSVDSPAGSLQVDGAFTITGLAVDPSLKAGKAIRFDAGREVLIDKQTAEGFRGNEQIPRFDNTEDVTKMEEIFVRKLRNFPYLFTNIGVRANELEQEIARVQASIAIEQTAFDNAERQRSERDTIISGLKQDQGNLNADLRAAESLLQLRQQQLQNLQTDLAAVKQQIQEQYLAIQQLNRAIEQTVYAGR